jgi:hypothetical protein
MAFSTFNKNVPRNRNANANSGVNYFDLLPNEITGAILLISIHKCVDRVVSSNPTVNKDIQTSNIKKTLQQARNLSLVCKKFSKLVLDQEYFHKNKQTQNENKEEGEKVTTDAFHNSSQEIWKYLADQRWLVTSKVNKVRSWYKFYKRR